MVFNDTHYKNVTLGIELDKYIIYESLKPMIYELDKFIILNLYRRRI
jgi:hypothetical protein